MLAQGMSAMIDAADPDTAAPCKRTIQSCHHALEECQRLTPVSWVSFPARQVSEVRHENGILLSYQNVLHKRRFAGSGCASYRHVSPVPATK